MVAERLCGASVTAQASAKAQERERAVGLTNVMFSVERNDDSGDEYSAFAKETPVAFDAELFALLGLLKTYDPLAYWSQQEKQEKFPRLFALNRITLVFPSSSIFQESLFSSAGDTLTQRRKRLLDSLELLESVVILRYYYNQIDSSERQERKKMKTETEVKPADDDCEIEEVSK